jgi:hypothetical protein
VNARLFPRALGATAHPEPPTPHRHDWPTAAHPWFGGAFPLCGMTLRPSADRAMLEGIFGPRDVGRRVCERTPARD